MILGVPRGPFPGLNVISLKAREAMSREESPILAISSAGEVKHEKNRRYLPPSGQPERSQQGSLAGRPGGAALSLAPEAYGGRVGGVERGS